MYPVLQRMLDEGWLADGWEDQAEAGREKRPPRRYYEVTDLGRSELGAIAACARADRKFARGVGDPQQGLAAG
jgi:PadR family transcriptional regulator, regulatory protein PadR